MLRRAAVEARHPIALVHPVSQDRLWHPIPTDPGDRQSKMPAPILPGVHALIPPADFSPVLGWGQCSHHMDVVSPHMVLNVIRRRAVEIVPRALLGIGVAEDIAMGDVAIRPER